MTPLVIGPEQQRALAALQELAAARPVDIKQLLATISDPEAKRRHMDQMNAQTVEIPFGFLVTYSIEAGHPCGICRHMSMSSPAKDRLPSPEAAWMIASELGFAGDLSHCSVWIEELQRPGRRAKAINVVQPLLHKAGGVQ